MSDEELKKEDAEQPERGGAANEEGSVKAKQPET